MASQDFEVNHPNEQRFDFTARGRAQSKLTACTRIHCARRNDETNSLTALLVSLLWLAPRRHAVAMRLHNVPDHPRTSLAMLRCNDSSTLRASPNRVLCYQSSLLFGWGFISLP
eukprot:5380997-Amphidinium_carterae.1